MPCGVRGQIFSNSAQVGNFFQITIHLLITRNRQHNTFVKAIRIVLIFFKYLFRNVQKWNITKIVCFSRAFTIHKLPLLSSEICSGRKLYTSINANPVYTQKMNTSRTSSSRSILNSFCHILLISVWLRNCLFTSTS